MTPQQKRVLAASRSFQGTCSADWSDTLGADGEGKILRVPARIEELAELYGCVFECIGWRNKTKVFRLVSEPERGISTPEPSPGEVPPSAGASLRVGVGRSVSERGAASLEGSGPAPAEASRAGADVPLSLFDLSASTEHWRAA